MRWAKPTSNLLALGKRFLMDFGSMFEGRFPIYKV